MEDKLRQRMKWVGKYISRPLLFFVLLMLCLYYFYPKAYEYLGIDIKDVGKYSFWFFLIKGIFWLVLFGYGFIKMRSRKK